MPTRRYFGIQLELDSDAANANQKFSFHFFFRFAAEGWGEEPQKKCKEIFGLLRASEASAARRVPAQSERTLRVQAITHAERAKCQQFLLK